MVARDVTAPAVGAGRPPDSRLLFRRMLYVFGAIALAALVLYAGLAATAANELMQVESIIATQSRSFAQHGTLYYGLRDYPFTVCAYMPGFYLLQSGLCRLGVPLLQAGRLVSLLALLSTFLLIWRIVEVYTGDKYSAWTGVVLAGGTQLLLS